MDLKNRVKFTFNMSTKFLIIGIIASSTLALAATNTEGTGKGVAIGTGSSAPKEENVAIGKGAIIRYDGGNSSKGTGDIVIGHNATSHNYYDQGRNIAIGENAYSEEMVGRQEKLLGFNQTGYNKFGFGSLPNNPEKVVSTITLGDNAYARSGGVTIGSHNYRGKLGDITINTDELSERRKYSLGVLATSIGANSFSNGALSSVNGAYSIISSKYDGNDSSYSTQNFGAVISGSLNSIESASSESEYSGMANAIVGTANRTSNSNGALIFGAGNEITNSIDNVDIYIYSASAGDLNKKLIKEISDPQKNNAGGSTLAIGGGNKADYTFASQLIGVKNTLLGEEKAISAYTSLNGYGNNATKVEHLSVQGSHNTVENAKENIVFGDYNKLIGTEEKAVNRNIIIGFQNEKENKIGTNINNNQAIGSNITIEKNTQFGVLLGDDTTIKVNGGVALGAKSVSDRKAIKNVEVSNIIENENQVYSLKVADDKDKKAIIETVKGDLGAVSVGNEKNTRQIINVAAGSKDSDAVNVAQLKAIGNKIDGASQKAEMAIGGVANAIAMSSLTQVSYRGLYKNQISAGYGYFGGEHAIAAGISGVSKNGKAIYKFIGSVNTKGDLGVGAAVGYQFNKDKFEDRDERLEKEIKRNADLENKVDTLKNELKALNDKMNNFIQNINNNSESKYSEKLYTLNGYRVDIYGLTTNQVNELRKIVKDINENYKGRTIDITGFTDTLANEKYNLELGLNRARQVLSKLKELGLSKEVNIGKVSSFGQNNVLDTNKTSNGKYSNRRVEILVK